MTKTKPMNVSIDSLILLLGLAGSLALLAGCLVVAGYLVSTSLPQRTRPKEQRGDVPGSINLFPW